MLGNKTYLVAQPSDKDMEALKQAIGVYIVKRRKSPLTRLVEDPGFQKLSPELQKLTLQHSLTNGGSEVEKGEPTPAELMSILGTPEATRFAAWMLIRKEHPAVSKETDIDPYITDGNCDGLFLEIMQAAGMTNLGN